MTPDAASRATMLGIARAAIDAAVRGAPAASSHDDAFLRQRRGVFVTLKHAGRLRGCVGRVEPDGPLSELLPAIAVLSATGDPRFPPVTPVEVSLLHIEISLLTTPTLIAGPAQIEIGRHGLMVTAPGRRGLLLPQVAAEYGWTPPEFLAQTCLKARLPADAWRRDGVQIHAFETESFGEDPAG